MKCPKCNSDNHIKRGKINGKQRYLLYSSSTYSQRSRGYGELLLL